MQKSIQLSGHAQIQLARRGGTEQEVIETIRAEKWGPTELGKMDCRRNFPFNKTWNGRLYQTKQVRPIFVEEEKAIVIITVYVYYF